MRRYDVGMDVHLATISMAVVNEQGRIVSEAIIETNTEAVRDFIQSLRGELHLTFEEGTQAAWLFDLLRPLVAEVVVCNPRHNKLLPSGNKSDRVDARRLAELLRHGSLRAEMARLIVARKGEWSLPESASDDQSRRSSESWRELIES